MEEWEDKEVGAHRDRVSFGDDLIALKLTEVMVYSSEYTNHR